MQYALSHRDAFRHILLSNMFSYLTYNAHQRMFNKRAESKFSYSEIKSFIRDHIYEKWNHNYSTYPISGQ